MQLALMIEGQEGVSWADWQHLAQLAEDGGFDALMRSDHYLSMTDPKRGALDAWGTICALATQTSRIRLGTLVSPVTFRPAAVLAKLVLTADHISGGRIDLGMGTGWFETEHETFNLDLPPMKERFGQLEQQVADVTRYLKDFQPEPVGPPRLILGGQAKKRAAALAATYADEYNVLYQSPDQVREKAKALKAATDAKGREPLRLSMMTGFAIGTTQQEIDDRRKQLRDRFGYDGNETWLIGTPEQAVDHLKALGEAGLDRVMLQHHLHDDDDAIRLITKEVIPAL
jgi:alkanesulfonate monooxygenase SsuD/methylene tetrahydromethanopterin reductase-like flavin-dependent oxidoreductase (luciferase family)